jgi:hypothetical protein
MIGEVSFEVYDPTLKDFRLFTSLPASQLKDEFEMLTIDWSDGDMLNVTVQAYDIFGEYNEETIIVYRDATPPIIQNLWLTKGDRRNISVHSVADFTQLTQQCLKNITVYDTLISQVVHTTFLSIQN